MPPPMEAQIQNPATVPQPISTEVNLAIQIRILLLLVVIKVFSVFFLHLPVPLIFDISHSRGGGTGLGW